MKKLFPLIFAITVVSACSTQPSVVVVTATQNVLPTATVTLAPSATATLAPSSTPTTPLTPTAEVYRPHEGCALLTRDWDDPVDGCLVNRNGNFTDGRTISNGIAVPLRWTLWNDTNPVPVNCTNNNCTFTTTGTQHQATTGLSQRVVGLEKGQCYLLKAVYDFRLKTSAVDPNRDFTKPPEDFPVNNVFAYARVNNRLLGLHLFTKDKDLANPADANFVSGVRSYIWPVRGGATAEADMTIGLRLQWGSTLSGSRVSLLGAYWFAAPDGYCTGVPAL